MGWTLMADLTIGLQHETDILRQHIKDRALLLLQIDEAKGQLRSITKLHGVHPQDLHKSDGQDYNLNTFETYLRRVDKLLQLSIERDGLSMKLVTGTADYWYSERIRS